MSVALSAATLGLATASWAQDDETRPCEEACFDTEDRCYETCENADASATCASVCQEDADRCLQTCE